MPFTNFLCEITGQSISVENCIAHAARESGRLTELVGANGERCHFTPALLRGIAEALKDEPMPDGAVRVTQLLGCAKRFQWQTIVNYAVYPHDGYALFRGQIGHTIVERYHGDEILLSEERLTVTFGGVAITGKPDAVLCDHHIDDYKTTRRVPREPYEHHEQQVNLYAWLIERARGVQIETASIVYLDMGEVARLTVPVWKRKATEKFLRERIALWHAGTPMPSAWECKTCPLGDECNVRIAPTRRGR